jgi:arylsulfatase A-like enzyme
MVEIVLNGVPIDTLRLHSTWEPLEYRVSLPAELQVVGENLLELCYAYNRRPSEVIPGSNDPRPLAVMWTSIYIDGVHASAHPTANTTSGEPALILPFNSSVSYYFKSPKGGLLTIDNIRPCSHDGLCTTSEASPVLRIAISSADRPDRETVHKVTVTEQTEGLSLRLPSTNESPVRISLTAILHEQSLHEGTGLKLIHPTIHTHTPPLGEPDQRAEEGAPAEPGLTASLHTRHNILIYLVDALRADHLGCYGYPKPTSPNIDAFARDATLFTATVAQSSWTRAAVASIFTGLYCNVHGTNDTHDALSNSLLVLPQILHRLGYATVGLIANANIDSVFGFSRGFESYDLLSSPSGQLNKRASDWLERRPQKRPFFLYLHSNDVHAPYEPPLLYRLRFAHTGADASVGTMQMLRALAMKEIESTEEIARDLEALYDAEIAFSDAAFGALINRLKELNLYDSTLIVFVSDHGEEFLDHGRWQHGQTLFSEQLHVPLIIKFPGRFGNGVRVSDTARHIDILPTLLDYINETSPLEVQGRSLLPFIDPRHSRATQTETFAKISRAGFEAETILSDGMKLIHNLDRLRGRPEFELYDLRIDPLETTNLVEARPVWIGYLYSRLKYVKQRWAKSAHEPERGNLRDVRLDERIRRELEALGYM